MQFQNMYLRTIQVQQGLEIHGLEECGGDTLFLIGSQNTWDTRILVKSFEDTRIHFIEHKVF